MNNRVRAQDPTEYYSVVNTLRDLVKSSVFPSLASLWWIPGLLLIGWGPLFLLDFVSPIWPGHGDELSGLGLAYGLSVSLVSTLLAVVLTIGHLVRLARIVFLSAFGISGDPQPTSLFGSSSINENDTNSPKLD